MHWLREKSKGETAGWLFRPATLVIVVAMLTIFCEAVLSGTTHRSWRCRSIFPFTRES